MLMGRSIEENLTKKVLTQGKGGTSGVKGTSRVTATMVTLRMRTDTAQESGSGTREGPTLVNGKTTGCTVKANLCHEIGTQKLPKVEFKSNSRPNVR